MKQESLDKFLTLRSIEAGRYAVKELVHEVDNTFIDFFLANEDKLDDAHKE